LRRRNLRAIASAAAPRQAMGLRRGIGDDPRHFVRREGGQALGLIRHGQRGRHFLDAEPAREQTARLAVERVIACAGGHLLRHGERTGAGRDRRLLGQPLLELVQVVACR